LYGVGTPLLMNQWLTTPQCKRASDMQMQPRSLLETESAVKQTTLVLAHGAPFSEMEPAGAAAGTVTVEYPWGTQGPPRSPVGIELGWTQPQLL
jgi:hypothetical protein